MKFDAWNDFEKGDWQSEINVRDFIQRNYTPYEGDSNFLANPTEKTKKLWDEVLELYKEEKAAPGGVLDIDTKTVSTVAAHDAGYIDKDLEEIVGLQTDKPLKRAIMPHNDGVFDVYTPDVRRARSNKLLTGLPDGYGRGRIIGDYRRVALYGVDVLIEEKKHELEELDVDCFTEDIIRHREEVSEQIKALRSNPMVILWIFSSNKRSKWCCYEFR